MSSSNVSRSSACQILIFLLSSFLPNHAIRDGVAERLSTAARMSLAFECPTQIVQGVPRNVNRKPHPVRKDKRGNRFQAGLINLNVIAHERRQSIGHFMRSKARPPRTQVPFSG